MASIISGFEYDIFISYRQKDNKYDGWVTEFVSNLKKELEAAFKEDVGVYFDINPHDGLLETHDVNASLKGKLKCLIFIPIISRTYCDPNSFAWEHEFKVFIRQASKDQFGLKVKLPNGNVASRVLPVQIYDLESADIKLCESVLGSVLRGVEFIYKSAGVNRPLTPSDNPDKNLTKTFYRDQINKVANSIKEIARGLKGEPVEIAGEPKEVISTIEKPPVREKSIIVLPFENISPDPDQEYFSDGLTEEIITDLSHIRDLLVISRSSAMTFKGAKATIKDITDKVHVRYVLEGSVRKAGNNLRITAQLIDGMTDSHIWAEKYNGNLDDIFEIQEKVSHSIVDSLKLKISPEENEFISRNPAKNLEAYNLYLLGRFFFHNGTREGQIKSIEYYEKALSEDPDYALAYAGLSDTYYVQGTFGWLPLDEALTRAKENSRRALDINKDLAEAHAILGVIYGSYDWKYKEAKAELSLAVSLNPKCSGAHQYYSGLLDALGQNEDARTHLNLAIELDPTFFYLYLLSAQLFYNEGKFEESLRECQKAIEIYPDFSIGHWRAFRIYIRQNEGLKAVEVIHNYLKRDILNAKEINTVHNIYTRAGVNGLMKWVIDWELKRTNPDTYLLATWYTMLGKKEQALDYLEEAVEKRIVAIPMINNDLDFYILHSEPRFMVLIEKMGLSEYQKPK
jgi:TolB-like protein/Tfp pilus assembly protein PilF